MANKVFLNDQDIVETAIVGDQTPESIEAAGEEVRMLLARLKTEKKPKLVLHDALRIGDVPPSARNVVVAYGKTLNYDKIAIVGKGGVLRLGLNLMFRAVGKTGQLEFFDNREGGFKWLTADTAPQSEGSK